MRGLLFAFVLAGGLVDSPPDDLPCGWRLGVIGHELAPVPDPHAVCEHLVPPSLPAHPLVVPTRPANPPKGYTTT
jgi:hypothetical protein